MASKRRLGAVAALTAGAGFGGHAPHSACLAFTCPNNRMPLSIRRRGAVHPVSSADSVAVDGSVLKPFKQTHENNRRPRNINRRTAATATTTSSTTLSAFWARGADTPPTDETKRDGNSFLRKILPRHSNSDSPSGGSSSVSLEKNPSRKRTTGRSTAHSSPLSSSSASSNSSPTARYYYVSPSSLHEQCPSWSPGSGPPAEECPLDDTLLVGAYEISEQLQERAGAAAAAAVAVPLAVPTASVDGAVDGGNVNEAVLPSKEEQQEQQKAASRLVEEALDGFIHRHALHTMNLKIKSDATSRSAVLLRGELGSVHATFDRLSFPSLKLSGGGTIAATGLNLNTASFVPALGRFVRRWSDPFTFHATDCVLTQEDLRTSRCINVGLTNVGNRILRSVVASDTSLDVVRIDRGARLSVSTVEVVENSQVQIRGVVTTILGSTIPFAVRTGLEVSRGGHVLHFPGLQVVLNPGPLQTILPLHLVHKVELDLGDRASLGKIHIDGRRKQIRLSATVSVTPRGSSAAARGRGAVGDAAAAIVKRAKYACDVGRWLTNLSFTT